MKPDKNALNVLKVRIDKMKNLNSNQSVLKSNTGLMKFILRRKKKKRLENEKEILFH